MVNKLQEYKLQLTVNFPSSVTKTNDLKDDKVYLLCYIRIDKSSEIQHTVSYNNITDGQYVINIPITADMIRTIGKGRLYVDIVCEIKDTDFPDMYRTERCTIKTNVMI